MRKIKKDDLVKVITGENKDKTGKVITVNTKAGTILIEGCNVTAKHAKPSAGSPNSGIINQEGPTGISNVMLVVDGKTAKVGFEVRNGKRVRITRATGKVID